MSSLLDQRELERRAAALRERLNAPLATSWLPWKQPEQPRELVGVAVRREVGPDRGYGETPCWVLRALDGTEWRVWLDKQALATQFRRQQVDVGDLVAIAYEGWEEADGENRAHHRFRLECETAPAAATDQPAPFADVGPEEAQPPPPLCDQCGFADGKHATSCPDDWDSPPF